MKMSTGRSVHGIIKQYVKILKGLSHPERCRGGMARDPDRGIYSLNIHLSDPDSRPGNRCNSYTDHHRPADLRSNADSHDTFPEHRMK